MQGLLVFPADPFFLCAGSSKRLSHLQKILRGTALRLEEYLMTNATLTDSDLAASLKEVTTEHFFTPEQFQRDADFYRAQRITTAMLNSGLISLSQFNKLSELNRKSFSPFLAEIMPKLVDKT